MSKRLAFQKTPGVHFCARAAIALGAAALALGCNGSSPTAPAMTSFQLMNAQVLLNGAVVNGMTMHAGQLGSGNTFFQATLMGPQGPALGQTVMVQYNTPRHMMSGLGYMYLYDDGTHGDPLAGDGIYCFDDEDGLYGFHMPGAPFGDYHYEFFGTDHEGHHSNHMQIMVTIAPDEGP